MSKPKFVKFEMKFVGWNYGSTRIERNESKALIEILEMSIDGVDILKLIPSSLFKENPDKYQSVEETTNE